MTTPAIPPALNRGVFGWDAVRLSCEYTTTELGAAMRQLADDPANANPERANGSLYLHTPKTRKRMDAIAWACRHIAMEQHA